MTSCARTSLYWAAVGFIIGFGILAPLIDWLLHR